MRFFAILQPFQQKLVPSGILYLACCCAAYTSFHFFTAPAVVSPTAGIALAGLILLGVEYWAAVFLGVYTAYALIGLPFVFVAAFAFAHTFQAVAGAYLLERLEFDTKLARLRDVLVFLVVAFSIATIVPTLGTAGMHALELLNETLVTPLFTWGHWWTGTIVSLLIVTPFIIRWYRWPQRREQHDLLEIGITLLVLVGISVPLFWFEVSRLGNISLVYFLLIPLFWTALRLGPRIMTLTLFLLTIIAIFGTFFGREGVSPVAIGTQLFQIEIFLAIIAAIFLTLVSTEEERKDTNKKLSFHVNELEHALGRLHRQEQAKNHFLATLAHELRNPLGTIVNYLELLKVNRHIVPEGEDSVGVIEKRLASIQRLLDDLFDISRISENKIILKRKSVDLRDVLTTATQNVDHMIRNRHQTLTENLPDAPLIIKADSIRLEQAFTNLLVNASKFTQRRGAIELTAVSENGSAVVTVKDTGIGIELANLERIFDSYYQGDPRARGTKAGLGIGLALARNFIQMHKGVISVKSEGKDMGTEFTVKLPLVKQPAPTPDTPAQNEDAQAGNKDQRILVVDDNKSAAEGVAKLLNVSGFTVQYATSGQEAIEKTLSFAPTAIFLDITLPDISGYDVARRLRTEHGFLGIIAALSGYGEEEHVKRAYGAGCNHYLTKPVHLAELLAVLK